MKEFLEKIFLEIQEYLDKRDSAREKALKLSRNIIRLSGRAVNALVKGEINKAREELDKLVQETERFKKILEPFPELRASGFYNNAMSEYAEAFILYKLVTEEGIPSPQELEIPPAPYLQGLGDVVGELRRTILEKLKKDDVESCWRLLEYMEAIQENMGGLDYPEPLIPGVRHKADTARKLVDLTKAFLVDIESRKKLTRLLKEFESRLK
jgi:translin